ncbi:MAG TPA: biopolymer transporter ExbD [Rhodanobacteraceae bacterium]|nr:biopolymer transporter ExbD [Rhodanobacteraceae bacterium]
MSFALARSHTAPEATINVTPLIDVMLALVVVLMIAAPILVKRFTLPLASSSETPAVAQTVHLGIGAGGELTWNDQTLLPGMLREQLRVVAQTEPQPELRIEVAPSTSYQSFAAVLADAKAAKIGRISVLDESAR